MDCDTRSFYFPDPVSFGQGFERTFGPAGKWEVNERENAVGDQNSETKSHSSRKVRDWKIDQHGTQRRGKAERKPGRVRENQHPPASDVRFHPEPPKKGPRRLPMTYSAEAVDPGGRGGIVLSIDKVRSTQCPV